MLDLQGVTKRFGGVVALDEVTFSVGQGEIVGLIGPNGAGKTTLFNCVTGLLRPERGDIRFGPQKSRSDFGDSVPDPPAFLRKQEGGSRGPQTPQTLLGLPSHAIVQCGVSRTFQNIRLFGSMSVLENVLVGTFIRTHTGLMGATLLTAEARREEHWAHGHAMGLLETVGLADRAEEPAGTLPVGLQRRLEIARALAPDPALLLLDEPAAGLNPSEKQQLLALIEQLKTRGLTILLIEHDMRVVMPISDRVVVLDYGRKIAEGPPQGVQADPHVIEAYLGVPRAGEDVTA